MDSFLLGNAVQKNGPDLIRYLREEDQQFPENVIHYLSNYKEKPPEFQDPELKQKICKFVSKKADFLFETPQDHEEKSKKVTDTDDTFAKMPPLETFMGIQEVECRKNFFNSIEKRDIVIGVVNSVMESGLVITLLCLDSGKSRDIDQLRISAFCPVKELPKLFPNQDAIEGFQVRDKVRAVVLSVNTETEKLIVSMVERSLPEENSSIKLALITEEEFPVQYRRKLHIRGLTFDELLHSILGFNNSGNSDRLLDILEQPENSSLMRGLHRLKIPEKDLAENLRKYQSQKMAHSSVAQGITYFKSGKQSEAIQCFNKALDIDKTNVEACVARGALYANNESFNRAIDDFEDALKINPNHANARKYLHDTLLAFGKSNEDIEKYKEAEDLYTKAMALEQSSVEAREALRFLHYKKSQRYKTDTRRKSSPKMEKRNESPEGFEKTAKTLKKLIKGEDRRHRKRSRKMSSESSSSSDSSDSGSRSRSSDRHRKRRDSKSRDRTQRNRSPPSDHHQQQPAFEEEVLPHQQYGVDPQSSFLSGGGATFSEIFRSSSQESEIAQEQQISAHMTSIPVHYGTDPYMYANPHANWYGIPGIDPTPMYGYGGHFPGIEQSYVGPAQAFYPGNQMPFLNDGRRKSRSLSRGRSHSDRSSRSSSFGSKEDTDIMQDRGNDGKRRESRDVARSNSLKYNRKSPESKNRKSLNSRENSREERSPSQDKSLRSWSESSFDDTYTSSMTRRKISADRKRQKKLSSSPRGNSPSGRKKSEDEKYRTSEKGRITEGGGLRNSMEKVSKEFKDKSKSTEKGSENKESSNPKQGKKKKEAGGEKLKSKKKKKGDVENKKKAKKSSESQSDIQNISGSLNESVNSVKGSNLGTTNRADGLVSDQINTVSSTSDAKKGNRKRGLGKEETPIITEDIRKVVRKDTIDIPESKNVKKDSGGKGIIKKRKDNKLLNQFTKSKWDSPDDLNNSPYVKHSSPHIKQTQKNNRDSYRQSSSKRSDSLSKQNKRSNSREFEGIRIHITNDMFGKQAESKSDLGVVEMFHVNQTHGETIQNENVISKTTEESVLPNQSIENNNQQSNIQSIETSLKNDSPKLKNETNKSRNYRKRSRSKSKSKSRSWSRSRSRSPAHNRRSRTPTHRKRSTFPAHKRSRSPFRRRRSRSPVHKRKSRSPVHRGRSRSPVHKGRSFSKSPHRRNIGRANLKTSRPMIRGRNKFTDSKSPSLSPGRKYSEGLRSNTRSYSARGRDNNRGSYKPSSGHERSRRSRSRSRGRIHARSQTGRRSRSRSYSRGQGNSREERLNEKSKQIDSGKTEKKTINELEDFFSKLKENKKNKQK